MYEADLSVSVYMHTLPVNALDSSVSRGLSSGTQ